MPSVICSGPECEKRRRHHDDPYTERGPQSVEVPEGHTGLAFCSFECAAYAGTGILKSTPELSAKRIEEVKAAIARINSGNK